MTGELGESSTGGECFDVRGAGAAAGGAQSLQRYSYQGKAVLVPYLYVCIGR